MVIHMPPTIPIKLKKINPLAIIPTRVHDNDFAYDLYGVVNVTLPPLAVFDILKIKDLMDSLDKELPHDLSKATLPQLAAVKKVEEAVAAQIGQLSAVKIDTGLALAPDDDYGILLWERSGRGSQRIIVLGGCMDAGYRGTYMVMLANLSNAPIEIKVGDKIAQMFALPRFDLVFTDVGDAELPVSERGSKGFGSSGS